MSETPVKIMNCVIFDEMKMKINKTIQTLEDRCTTMATSPEIQWLSTKGKQELRTQRIADGDQKLSWQLCFKESEDFP